MDDYFLGKDNFAADRATASKALAAWPATRTAARESQAFLGRAVRYLAQKAGITSSDAPGGISASPLRCRPAAPSAVAEPAR